MNVFVKVDTSGLNAALAQRAEILTSRRTMRDSVCTAAYYIARNAQRWMPGVSQGTIDSELAVEYSMGKTAKGKASSARKNMIRGSGLFGATRRHSGIRPTHQVPLAALIIQSSSRPWSRYNALTKSRYAIKASPFKGKTREAGRQAMRQAVHRMIGARHSSTNFLKAGWGEAVRQLYRLADHNGRGGSAKPEFPRNNKVMGEAVIYDDGKTASVYISNEAGDLSINAQSFNEALWLHGAPALQVAVNYEENKMLAYIEKKLNDQNAEFNAK